MQNLVSRIWIGNCIEVYIEAKLEGQDLTAVGHTMVLDIARDIEHHIQVADKAKVELL